MDREKIIEKILSEWSYQSENGIIDTNDLKTLTDSVDILCEQDESFKNRLCEMINEDDTPPVIDIQTELPQTDIIDNLKQKLEKKNVPYIDGILKLPKSDLDIFIKYTDTVSSPEELVGEYNSLDSGFKRRINIQVTKNTVGRKGEVISISFLKDAEGGTTFGSGDIILGDKIIDVKEVDSNNTIEIPSIALNVDFTQFEVQTQHTPSVIPWSVNVTAYGTYQIADIDCKTLILDDPGKTLPTTTTTDLSYSLLDSDGLTMISSATGVLQTTRRGRVDYSSLTSYTTLEKDIKPGFYFNYSGDQYQIIGFNKNISTVMFCNINLSTTNF